MAQGYPPLIRTGRVDEPCRTRRALLLGIFAVNPSHNVVHLLSTVPAPVLPPPAVNRHRPRHGCTPTRRPICRQARYNALSRQRIRALGYSDADIDYWLACGLLATTAHQPSAARAGDAVRRRPVAHP